MCIMFFYCSLPAIGVTLLNSQQLWQKSPTIVTRITYFCDKIAKICDITADICDTNCQNLWNWKFFIISFSPGFSLLTVGSQLCVGSRSVHPVLLEQSVLLFSPSFFRSFCVGRFGRSVGAIKYDFLINHFFGKIWLWFPFLFDKWWERVGWIDSTVLGDFCKYDVFLSQLSPHQTAQQSPWSASNN